MNSLNDVIFNYDMAVKCLASRHMENVIRFRSQIDAVFRMLSDEESKYAYGQDILYCMLSNFVIQELSAVIAGNMTWPSFRETVRRARSVPEFGQVADPGTPATEDVKYQCLATTFLLEQYRYKDRVTVRPGDVCIDAGACLGDTALYFCRNGARKVYSFETDRGNISCLKQTAARFGLEQKIEICEAALAAQAGTLHFTPDPSNNGAGKVSKEPQKESYAVPAVSIDGFCKEKGIHPDFIKMDIEGAEPAALQGARQTILENRPRLAISIYHAWQHRWEIPLLVRDMTPGYEYYVKKSQPYTETILLAAPRQSL